MIPLKGVNVFENLDQKIQVNILTIQTRLVANGVVAKLKSIIYPHAQDGEISVT